MSAVRPLPRWASLLNTLIDDKRNGAPEVRLEVPDVPRWVEELDGQGLSLAVQDMTGTLQEALSDTEKGQRARLNDLLKAICVDGEKLPICDAIRLQQELAAVLVDYCSAQAERMVEQNMGLSVRV